jgi:hypothetical protein
VTGPVLIDILRPRIVVPTDFDVRYGPREARADAGSTSGRISRAKTFWLAPSR